MTSSLEPRVVSCGVTSALTRESETPREVVPPALFPLELWPIVNSQLLVQLQPY
jgi:hypothetical protein